MQHSDLICGMQKVPRQGKRTEENREEEPKALDWSRRHTHTLLLYYYTILYYYTTRLLISNNYYVAILPYYHITILLYYYITILLCYYL